MVFIVKYVKHLESIKLYSLRNSKDPCMYIQVKKQIIAHSWEATCTSLLNHIPPPSSKYTFTLIWVNQSLAVLYSISTCVHNSLPFLKVVPHKTPSGYLRSWKKKKGKFWSLSHVWLCNSMDCSPSGSLVHGILQARILEWVAISFSSGFSQPRDWTQVSYIRGSFFTVWATREAQLRAWIVPDTVYTMLFPIHTYIPMIQFNL